MRSRYCDHHNELQTDMAKNTKFELVSPSEVFNFIQDDEDLLLIDARPRNSYKKGHLRRSTCVAITPSGRNIDEVAGPGAPTWSNHCWWDRHVLLVVSAETEKAARKDLQKMQGKRPDELLGTTKWDANATEEAEASAKRQKVEGELSKTDAVVGFLLREGLTRNLKIMVSGQFNRPQYFLNSCAKTMTRDCYVTVRLLFEVLSLSCLHKAVVTFRGDQIS